jgi:hypothetical protein
MCLVMLWTSQSVCALMKSPRQHRGSRAWPSSFDRNSRMSRFLLFVQRVSALHRPTGDRARTHVPYATRARPRVRPNTLAPALRERVYLCFRNCFEAIAKCFEMSPLPYSWTRGALPTSGFGCFGRYRKKHLGAPGGLTWARRHSETSSGGAQSDQRSRGFCISLGSSEAIPSDGLSSVLRNTSTLLEYDTQVALS